MNVLVAFATRHGATAEIAGRIATRLQAAGVPAEARSVNEVNDVGPYDAVIIGGAAYMFHWLKDATTFAKRHQTDLNRRPVWLFSSGPLGNDLVDKDGQDVVVASRPKEFDELQALLHPRNERVFFGAWDPNAPPVGIGERLLRLMPAAKETLPAGDFRDWPVIDAWGILSTTYVDVPGGGQRSGHERLDVTRSYFSDHGSLPREVSLQPSLARCRCSSSSAALIPGAHCS
ncbi:flavodoxin domain-containing protein [Arthrobacter sp. StoSoilB5]|uniref:flavodoxin domain-containing protein n=1 Tax=Arthrobacter sp. StoSoilB5 TaxID=2830992 RepID=UPI001CC683F8|nr:flavodoxin domain-containing protein [Arthrobacter sp. StoSoilB5]